LTPISDIKVPITKDDKGKTIEINISNEGNRGVGQLEFPPGMLHEGWIVLIQSVDPSISNNSNNCENNIEPASAVLKIQVIDSDGNQVKHFNQSFQLSLYAVIKDSSKDVCLGYSNNDNEGWKCDTESMLNSTGSSSVFLVKTKSDHLTSFAVLLGSGFGDLNCGWGWIEIASLAMLASTAFFSSVVVSLYCISTPFRTLIKGRNDKAARKRMRRTLQNVRRTMMLELQEMENYL